MSMIVALAIALAIMFLLNRLFAWRGGVSGKDFAVMRVDKHHFKKGCVYRISERDYLGRELWSLAGTDDWVGPDDFDPVSWKEAERMIVAGLSAAQNNRAREELAFRRYNRKENRHGDQ